MAGRVESPEEAIQTLIAAVMALPERPTPRLLAQAAVQARWVAAAEEAKAVQTIMVQPEKLADQEAGVARRTLLPLEALALMVV